MHSGIFGIGTTLLSLWGPKEGNKAVKKTSYTFMVPYQIGLKCFKLVVSVSFKIKY